jgi:hypothetical protein
MSRNASTAQKWANRESFFATGAGLFDNRTFEKFVDLGLSALGLAGNGGRN